MDTLLINQKFLQRALTYGITFVIWQYHGTIYLRGGRDVDAVIWPLKP